MKITIGEAAQRLNMSTDSVRRRLRTGILEGQRDHRGQWWLELPDNTPPEPRAAPVDQRMGLGVGTPLQRSERESLIAALEDQIDDLKARLDRSEAERRDAVERFRSERDRLLSMIERLSLDGAAK